MNTYSAELKRISENYENYNSVEDLQIQLHALTAIIDNEAKEETATAIKASDLVTSIVAQFFKADAGEDTVKTGLTSFDRAINGFEKGEFIVIGARPGMGKTKFMVQLTTNMARQNKGIAFLSLEMSAEMITKQILCNLGKLQTDVFKRPDQYNPEIELSLSDAIKQLKELPIYLYENPGANLNKLLVLIRNVVLENNVRVVFVDYLQLISLGSRRFNRESEIAIVCRELKKLAMELGITMIVSSQLSRQVENRPGGSKRPQLSDLRESGSIEQDADKVIFIYRAEYYGIEVDENNCSTRNIMELILSKNRNGFTVDVPVYADFARSVIVDIDSRKSQLYERFTDLRIDSNRLKEIDDVFK